MARRVARPAFSEAFMQDVSGRLANRVQLTFGKKIENHAAMIALYFMYYNFGQMHQTLRVTPAMEAKIANHVGSVEESLTC